MGMNVSYTKKIRVIIESKTLLIEGLPIEIQEEIDLLLELQATRIGLDTFELTRNQAIAYFSKLASII